MTNFDSRSSRGPSRQAHEAGGAIIFAEAATISAALALMGHELNCTTRSCIKARLVGQFHTFLHRPKHGRGREQQQRTRATMRKKTSSAKVLEEHMGESGLRGGVVSASAAVLYHLYHCVTQKSECNRLLFRPSCAPDFPRRGAPSDRQTITFGESHHGPRR